MQNNILELDPPKPGVRIAYGADANQFGELRVPAAAPPHPVALVIHGGFWRAAYDLKHIGHLCEALQREGIATWSIEYRRIGQEGGGWPGCGDDVRAAALHLKVIAAQHRLDLARAVAVGHSAGGHLALWLAAENPIPLRGVVSLAGVTDLRRAFDLKLSRNVVQELMGEAPAESSARYASASPIERLPLPCPIHLVHGIEDKVVPIEFSSRFERACTAKRGICRVIALPGTGHFEVIDPRTTAWAEVRDAIRSLLF